MSTQVNTVLFDLDGTLIDTNELIIASFLHVFEKYAPGQYKREDVLPFLGPTLRESFEKIQPEKVDEMIADYRAFNIAHHDELVKEFPGVLHTVNALKEAGLKVGIVTTKIRFTVEMGLKLTGLQPLFDVVVTLDDVQNAKPDPEPILLALQLLGSKPEETIMVGDNSHDIQGGKNAGTKTAGVAWSIKGAAFLQQYSPDFLLDTMPELLDILEVEVK